MTTENTNRGAGWRAVLLTTVEGALLAGLVSLTAWLARTAHSGSTIWNLDWQGFLLSPVAHAALLLPAMAATLAVVRIAGWPAGRAAHALLVVAYTYACAQGTLLIPRIHVIAALLLAAGAGTALALVGRRPRPRAVFQWLGVSFGAAVVVVAFWAPLSRQARHRMEMRALADAPDDAPNVLLLILDTVGAGEMSLYGYPRRTTPVLDSLARHGVVFERAIASAPWTLPSHGSMFTGRRAIELSARYLTPLDGSAEVVAEEFARAGYTTGGFVANLEYTSRASGLSRGFHQYRDYVPSFLTALAETPLGARVARQLASGPGRPWQPGRKDANQVNREFLAWEDAAGDRPWFAFLNYYDAHDPYVPPVPDERRFLRPGQVPVYDLTGIRASDTAAVSAARALYDASLFSLDRAIGQLLDSLRARGDLERTVIVVTSDHGEEWGEHGLLRHGNSVYFSALHVPLVIVHRGTVPAGVRVTRPSGTRHLAPTLLDLAGISTDGVEGLSLASRWQDPANDTVPAVVLSWVERSIRQPPEYPASSSELISVITDSAQVIFGKDTTLFDLGSILRADRNHLHDPGFLDDFLLAIRTIRSSR